jgi:hypothetical protein
MHLSLIPAWNTTADSSLGGTLRGVSGMADPKGLLREWWLDPQGVP